MAFSCCSLTVVLRLVVVLALLYCSLAFSCYLPLVLFIVALSLLYFSLAFSCCSLPVVLRLVVLLSLSYCSLAFSCCSVYPSCIVHRRLVNALSLLVYCSLAFSCCSLPVVLFNGV